eukprot:CAMPEP_0201946634 /NCGR_PEP_ID=MMETSP0903-20130614/54520_1 /ASSEMBLY_ACC=CAM_ASM_000552 /TAXON_ID=420261 /ORGANISM="Thalassiosira antarctica, Strain CCMP982" /LENGTH=883 /DNA_ID=CAMNT_0048489739 /DNA_START=113 /DNA_END=2764 /DNA_ORIENTATION=+
MAIKSLKCSGLHTREINVPNCVNGQPCKRVYHIFLPRILCHGGARLLHTSGIDNNYDSSAEDASIEFEDEVNKNKIADHDHPHRHTEYDGYFTGEYYNVGTLPLVFILHGFGSDSRSMMNFLSLADTFHSVLVLPEGLENSFNGGDCCGYALENKVDDIGFLSQIQTTMTSEFDFLGHEFSFGIGHNNGAFLLTYALEHSPHLFRSIVLIDGYTHRVDQIRSRLGVGDRGIGIMIQHSLDDIAVRPSGCCDNTHLPECHGDVRSDYCMSVLQIFDLWASQINMCDNDGDSDGGGFGSYVVGRSGGLEYSLSYHNESKSTVLSLTPDINDPQTIDTLFNSNLPMSVSYNGPNSEVICLTTSSPSCIANSTLCVYNKKENSNGIDFGKEGKEFSMFNEATAFIAQEACSANDGMLEVIPGGEGRKPKHVCACVVSGQNESAGDFGGVFCFDALNADGTFKTLASSQTTDAPSMTVSNTTGLPNQEVAESPQIRNETVVSPASNAFEISSNPVANESVVEQNETTYTLASNDLDVSEVAAGESSTEQKNHEQILSKPVVNEYVMKQNETTYTLASNDLDVSELAAGESSTEQKNHEQILSKPVVNEYVMKQNGTTYTLASNDLDISDLATGESQPKQKNHEYIMIWVSLLLAIFTILGVALRRRRMRKNNLAITTTRYQDNVDNVGSPYRDFFQKGNRAENTYRGYVDEGEIGDCESEHEEHCPPYRYRGETELVNQNDKNSADDIGGELDRAHWEKNRLLSRYDPDIGADRTKQHIMDDYSFTRSFNSSDDNSSQQSHQSHQTLPESLLHVIKSPATYLDTADRRMLRRYRQQDPNNTQGSNSAILRRKSSDLDGEVSIRSSFSAPKGKVDVLDEDLEDIESEIV